MEEDKSTASQKVFSEMHVKAIIAVPQNLLEEALKHHVGALQLEKHCTVESCHRENWSAK